MGAKDSLLMEMNRITQSTGGGSSGGWRKRSRMGKIGENAELSFPLVDHQPSLLSCHYYRRGSRALSKNSQKPAYSVKQALLRR